MSIQYLSSCVPGGTPRVSSLISVGLGAEAVASGGGNAYISVPTLIPFTGTINNFVFSCPSPDSITSGMSVTCTLVVNGTASPLSVSISGTSTIGVNTSTSVVVVRGDSLNLQLSTSGASYVGGFFPIQSSLELTPSTAGEQWFVSKNFFTSPNKSGDNKYVPFSGGGFVGGGTSTDSSASFVMTQGNIIPVAGTIHGLLLQSVGITSATDLQLRATIMVNGSPTTLTATCNFVASVATTGENTVDSITVTQGDIVGVKYSLFGGTGNAGISSHIQLSSIFKSSDPNAGIWLTKGFSDFVLNGLPDGTGGGAPSLDFISPVSPIAIRRELVKLANVVVDTENCFIANLQVGGTTSGQVVIRGQGTYQATSDVVTITSYGVRLRNSSLFSVENTTPNINVIRSVVYSTDTSSSIESISPIISAGVRTTNDDFLDAVSITTLGVSYTAFNRCASFEAGEPTHGGDAFATKSMWWTWNPGSFTGTALVTTIVNTTSGSHRGVFAAYLGTTVSALSLVASNSGTNTLTSFAITPNTTYRFAIATGANRWYSISVTGTFEAVLNTNDNWACMSGDCFEATGCPTTTWTLSTC